jgi:hypothetical protein
MAARNGARLKRQQVAKRSPFFSYLPVKSTDKAAAIDLLHQTGMMIDDDTLKQLLRINDELLQLCKWLNEKRDMETSSRLIPLVDDLTHILIEAGKNNLY